MSESFSVERRKLMRFLGAKVVLTPAPLGASGMVAKCDELAAANGWFRTRQFENEANPDYHSKTTAQEILRDFEGERLDYWVTGFGTGGTLTGRRRGCCARSGRRPDHRGGAGDGADADLAASRRTGVRTGQPQCAIRPGSRIRSRAGAPISFRSITGDAVDEQLIDEVVTVAGTGRH